MRHFGIYSDSSELEQAYQNGDIINPYVALVSGALDYNSLEPCYLGKWNGTIFEILDTDPSRWGGVTIGQLPGVFYGADTYDFDIILRYDSGWQMELFNPDLSDSLIWYFEEGVADGWETGAMTDPNESISSVVVYYDGDKTFSFDIDPNFLVTINPECSEEGPSE